MGTEAGSDLGWIQMGRSLMSQALRQICREMLKLADWLVITRNLFCSTLHKVNMITGQTSLWQKNLVEEWSMIIYCSEQQQQLLSPFWCKWLQTRFWMQKPSAAPCQAHDPQLKFRLKVWSFLRSRRGETAECRFSSLGLEVTEWPVIHTGREWCHALNPFN